MTDSTIDTADTTPTEPVEADPAAPPTDPVDPPAPADPAAPPADPAEADTFDRAYVDKLRREAADYRTKRKAEADRADQVETKLNSLIDGLKGLTGDKPEEQSPDEIIAALTAERDQYATEREQAAQQLNTYRTEQAVTRAAQAAGADAELTTLVLRGKGALDNLDPTADDYTAQVAALIDTEVNANPKLKATPAVPQSSGSTPEDQASPRAGQLTRDDMKNMSPKEINDAVREGRFRDVLGG